ncbi:nucleoside monophosphate kinase [bacterium]|jgi:adenylate kinase|nr:nucleoside monophosphate kinase [bacterium]NBW56675.1 nucleoside monophosphate kinase [bacterium]NBX72040.1 nucleoside monophosphate kinase [bacterium]
MTKLKKIILIGPPGSGKGTQATQLAAHYDIPSISTGHILREEVRLQSSLGKKIQETIESGALVSDEVMIKLIEQRLNHEDCNNGFILDGFPRTLSQAQALSQSNLGINFVFYMRLDDLILIERLSGRRVHEGSGRSYHILYNPPKQEGLDDVTHEPLVQRVDDHPENIKRRLVYFHQLTTPVIEYYETKQKQLDLCFKTIDAHQEISLLTMEIIEIIK